MSKPKHTADNPIEIWQSTDGWEWRILRKNQKNDSKPFASWYCFVTTPYLPEGEYGDVYVDTIRHRAERILLGGHTLPEVHTHFAGCCISLADAERISADGV